MTRRARPMTDLETIRKWKGEVKIGMLIANDVVYVKCVKADLLWVLQDVSASEYGIFEKDGILFVTNC